MHVGGCRADNRLFTYLQHAPLVAIKDAETDVLAERSIQKIQSGQPHKIASKLFKAELAKGLMPTLSGFPALYAGYIDYSNEDGLIQFPLRHTAPKVYLVVTPAIKMVPLSGNTFQFLKIADDQGQFHEVAIEKPEQTQIYCYERKKLKDETLFWEVSAVDIPESRRISMISIVLLTPARNVMVQTGSFVIDATQQLHLQLPSPFIVGEVDKNKALIGAASMLPFFEPIDVTSKKINEMTEQDLLTNS